ncbi:MAG: hypothetical protein CMG00_06320 [Candidatus Marinimicrobia bacterium]|nr:hypothetical protein [Candidatus Neomarinimicrobiota bacterium]|tara:strand:+ start:4472 stop:6415 length:1944 start_codon:yes stop_codon:yes gene_type:complete
MEILISLIYLYCVYLNGSKVKSFFLEFKKKNSVQLEILLSISFGFVIFQFFASLISIFNQPNLYKFLTIVFLFLSVISSLDQILENLKFIIRHSKKLIYVGISFHKFNLILFLEFSILLVYFLLSFIPISSGDSLDYHLGVAIQYLNFTSYDPTWYTSLLAMNGEKLIASFISVEAIPLITLIQYLGLINVYFLVKEAIFLLNSKYYPIKNKYFGYILQTLPLVLVSSPVFIFLTLTAKPQLFPTSLLVITSFLFLNIVQGNLKFSKKNLFFLFFLIFTATTSKYSLVICGSINIIALLIYYSLDLKSNQKEFNFKINQKKTIAGFLILFSAFLILYIPFAIHRVYFYESSLFNAFFSPLNRDFESYSFLNWIKTYTENKLPFPFYLIIPTSFSNLTSILGLLPIYVTILFLYIRNKIFFIFSSLIIFLISIIAPPSTRFFLAPIILLLFFIFMQIIKQDKIYSKILENISINFYSKMFNGFAIFQGISILLVLSLFYFSYIRFSLQGKSNFEFNNINGYSMHKYLEEKFDNKYLIFLDSRTRSVSNQNFASLDPIDFEGKDSYSNFLKLKEKKNLQDNTEIVLVSNQDSKVGNQLNKCFKNSNYELKLFESATRNPFSEYRKTVKWVIRKVKYKEFLDCNFKVSRN